MRSKRIDCTIRSIEETEERLTITVGGLQAGEATVQYGLSSANVLAHVDLRGGLEGMAERLEQFHAQVAEELMVHVLDRGVTPQDGHGAVTYTIGTRARSLPLPTHAETGLGFPNSW